MNWMRFEIMPWDHARIKSDLITEKSRTKH